MQHKSPEAGKATAKGETPLQTSSSLFPANVVRQTWLHYFNDYLRERHIITEDEWRKMRRLIDKD